MSKQKKNAAPENPHEGHRERLRKKFLTFGIQALAEHEVLEMLLFYVHARCNTNGIAHALLDKFGSIRGVMNADYEELQQIKGIGEKGATLLKLLPGILQLYETEELRADCLMDPVLRCRYFCGHLAYEKQEVVLLACLNSRYQVVRCVEIGRGEPDHVQIDNQQLLRAILFSNCTCAILAHNHPMGIAAASFEDINVTSRVSDLLRSVNVLLLDHVIVGGDGKVISMSETGAFSPDR